VKIISFVNQKGGTGKTTSTLNIGACLAREGFKVLLVDLDPQGNLTTSAGITVEDEESTIYEVFTQKEDPNSIIKDCGGYDLLPTDIRLSKADIELASVPGRELLLKEAIASLKTAYDYILVDCPPSLSIVTLMSLTASTDVIIPVQAQFLPLKGMTQLLDTIELVKQRLNHNIEILAFIVTMYDGRKTLDRQVYERIEKEYPSKIFKQAISSNVALAEAPAYGQDIYKYDSKCKGAAQYEAITDEIIERG
jgi:chromosome partitioning protein